MSIHLLSGVLFSCLFSRVVGQDRGCTYLTQTVTQTVGTAIHLSRKLQQPRAQQTPQRLRDMESRMMLVLMSPRQTPTRLSAGEREATALELAVA